jgi:hypothetical protein
VSASEPTFESITLYFSLILYIPNIKSEVKLFVLNRITKDNVKDLKRIKCSTTRKRLATRANRMDVDR